MQARPTVAVVKIDYGFLAAGVTYDELTGYPSAEQIGVDLARVESLPKQIALVLVARIRWDSSDMGPQTIGFTLTAPDGTVTGFGEDLLVVDKPKSVVTKDIVIPADQEGIYEIGLRVADVDAVSVEMAVTVGI